MSLNKILKDRPGVVPVATIRTWFEKLVTDSSSLDLPLGRTYDGAAYQSEAVQKFFIGFGICIRHAERMSKSGMKLE